LDRFIAGEAKEEIGFDGEPLVPFGADHIMDATREIYQPTTYLNPAEGLRNFATYYRRSLWAQSKEQVIIVCEKETLRDLIAQVTDELDVPLAIMHGQGSKPGVWEIAELVAAEPNKQSYIYYLGDYDLAGDDIVVAAMRRVERYRRSQGPKPIQRRLAITPEQIKQFKLELRPPKERDEGIKKFSKGCVELDAIEPSELLKLVREAIEQHTDKRLVERIKREESKDRERLEALAEGLE
jgi:hypothetical protein